VLNQLNVFERDGGTFAPNTTVVLDIGANDIATGVDEGTIRNNLNEIVSRLGASGVNVILSGQPEAHSYDEAIKSTNLQMDDLYKEIAENNPNVTLVDAMSGMLNDKELMDESGFHLNSEDAKFDYINKFADAYKGTETTNQDVVETPNVGGLTQVSQPELDQSPPIMSDNIPAEIVTDKAENDSDVIPTDKAENDSDVIFTDKAENDSDVAEAIAQLGDNQQDFEIAEAGDNMDDYQPSAGYTYAQNNSSIDNYYQVINDFLSQDRSQDEIQAAMEQYGVSQSDIDAAKSMQPQSEMERAKGGAIRMQVGGLSALAKLGTAGTKLTKAEMASLRARGMGVPGIDFADPLKAPTMRMSEALGNVGAEGKTLNFTEADRSRVFAENMGGIGFTGLQNYSVPHKQARTVWGFGNQSTAEKKIAQNDPDNTIWTTYAGSPEQHKSNTVVVKDAVKTLQQANTAGAVNPEQIKLINQRIKQAKNDKGNPLFSDDFDITDPQAINAATTFERRTAISDALMGVGVRKPMISKEFKAANPNVKYNDASNISRILTRETDPVLANANTFDIGPHLFVMDNKIINRADLNEAFPIQVTGDDLGMRFIPTPVRSAAPEFMKKKGYGPTDPVNAWAMSRGNPKQFVSEEYLTNLQKEGYKDGGSAEPAPFHDFDQIMKRKDGGTVSTFEQRLKSAIDQHMAGGGTVERQYAKAGSVLPPTPQEIEQMAGAQKAAFGVFPQMASQRWQQPSPTMDKASELLKAQVTKEWEQAGQPGGVKGLALRISAVLAGGVPDFVNFAQSMIPALNEEKPSFTTVLDSGKKPPAPYRDTREMQTGIKYPMSGTSTDIKNSMREKGMINDDEYPIAELLGSFAAPYAAVKAPRAIEGGLNSVTAAARRPFTPATLTTEAVSPDLAKFKNPAFQDYATKQMIGEGSAVPMTTMGGRQTSQTKGQGVYLNDAGELERNPMVGVNIPRAGNLATNKGLRADIATAGQELGQEAMAAHRFVPMATNQIKDASAMMIRGQGGRPLTNKEVMAMANELPGMIVTHSPANGGLMIAPYSMTKGQIPQEFLSAQSVARKVLGKDASIQFGKADEKKDLMYMMRNQYAEEGGRGTTPSAQDIRNKLKRMDTNFPLARQ